jgi:hypothetical protein
MSRRRRRSHARENPGLGLLLLIGAGIALTGGAVYVATRPKTNALAASVPLPAGTYQQSCTGCTATSNLLTCTGCKDFNGNPQTTTFALPHTGDISNNNGVLSAG